LNGEQRAKRFQYSQNLKIIPMRSGPDDDYVFGGTQQDGHGTGERKREDEEHSRGRDGLFKGLDTPAEKQRKAADSNSTKKQILYKNPKVKVGDGKLGPIDLVIYKDDLYALKRIPKQQIDKPKRIEHLKNEKFILLMLKRLHEDFKNGKYNKYSANDCSTLKQLLYDDFNGSRDNNNKDNNKDNSNSAQRNNESTTWTSYRNSYNIDEM